MIHRRLLKAIQGFALAAGVCVLHTGLLHSDDQIVKYIDPRESEGSSAAVVVPDLPLVHTAQFLPVDASGKLVGKGQSAAQFESVFDRLHDTLQLSGSGAGQIVKLHVVAADDATAAEVRRMLSKRFAGSDAKPAVTYVVGKLRHPDALVAIDAVVRTPVGARGDKGQSATRAGNSEKFAALSTLPPGPKVYVSGQAEKGTTIGEMTRRTMESLGATLGHLGLSTKDVVQIKSFIGPISAVDEAEREIAAFFKNQQLVPPMVFVEWTTSPSIEIELIAGNGKSEPGTRDSVEFITPPGMTASPVYSRVARMAAGPTIYVSGLYGASSVHGEAETLEIFAQLGKLLEKSGSDFRHLVKATYYVSTDEAGAKLNELRPRFYDPKRPPAASKAPVAGTGLGSKTITLDMIAASKESRAGDGKRDE